MTFILAMAWRETRAAWRHFLYFFICIALGVGALVGVGVFAANVEQTVTREARSLTGGDVEVRTARPLGDRGRHTLEALKTRGIRTIHVSELVAMASRIDGAVPEGRAGERRTQLVELKAVEEGYPLYGTVTTSPARPLTDLLAGQPCVSQEAAPRACHGAVVHESLLIKMGLRVGDTLKVGQAALTISGTIHHEPDRAASAFSLGPRVMISQAALTTADLVKPGSRVRERHLLKLPPDVPPETVVPRLRDDLEGASAQVSTFREGQPRLRRFLDQLTRYLGLVGLTALFVGGIGVASTVHAFLKEKLKTIAILKTVGADSRTVIHTYLTQALFLGCAGSLVGVLLGTVLQWAMPALLAQLVPAHLLHLAAARVPFALEPVAKGLALGLATTLLFTLWPLLGVRDIRPAVILRADVARPREGASWRRRWQTWGCDRVRVMTALAISAALAGLAIWQAESWLIGLLFIGALIVAVMVLLGAAAGMIRLVTLGPAPSSLAWRHALGNVSRPGSQTAAITMSIGLGVMIIVTISLLERSLIGHIGDNRPVDAPTFFFIDIQPDQAEGFGRLLRARMPDGRPELTPVVRARLFAVNGHPITVDPDRVEPASGDREQARSWYFSREYVLTFLDALPKGNTVLKGTWWHGGARPESPLVSVEEDAARNLGVDLGSTIEFDIQGTTLPATVSSIRKVDWNTFSTNFYMILSPGSLDGAPFTYVATIQVSPEEELPLQQTVVEAFPNVTAINIGEVMSTFSRVLEHLSFAIRAVAIFCILAGVVVMAAALATTRYRRLYESVIFKALGATRTLIAGAFAAEYALTGLIAGLIGIALANVLSWAVLDLVFDLSWTWHPDVLLGGLVVTVGLTVAVGFLSTFRLLGERPLRILRQE